MKIPACPQDFFKIEFHNPTEEEIEYSAIFSMANPFAVSSNQAILQDGLRIIKLYDDQASPLGDLSLITENTDCSFETYWFRGSWSDGMDVFIHELRTCDKLTDRSYFEPRQRQEGREDVASLAMHRRIAGGACESAKFVLSWSIPNNDHNFPKKEKVKLWKNYYATVYTDSVASGIYCYRNFDSLLERTRAFRAALDASDLDPVVLDAVSSNLSVLKSPTVLRLEDGSFYGWEGVHELEGSSEGTCQHVWNYAYALCFFSRP